MPSFAGHRETWAQLGRKTPLLRYPFHRVSASKANGSNGSYGRGGGDRKQCYWNFTDLEEMRRSTKALKRHTEEHEAILIGPLMDPRLFRVSEISFFMALSPTALSRRSAPGPNLTARMASRPQNLTQNEIRAHQLAQKMHLGS